MKKERKTKNIDFIGRENRNFEGEVGRDGLLTPVLESIQINT